MAAGVFLPSREQAAVALAVPSLPWHPALTSLLAPRKQEAEALRCWQALVPSVAMLPWPPRARWKRRAGGSILALPLVRSVVALAFRLVWLQRLPVAVSRSPVDTLRKMLLAECGL